jgi:hypothetical protein
MRSLILTLGALGFLLASTPSAPACDECRRRENQRQCGRSSEQLLEAMMKRFDVDREAALEKIKEHFKRNHPDGLCHCMCRHEREEHLGKDEDHRPHHEGKGISGNKRDGD